MLELVTIFLATLLISTVAIRSYRRLSSWRGFSSTVVARRNKTVRMKLKPQQGYVSLIKKPAARQKVKTVRLRNGAGTIKAPWGW